MVKHVFVDFKEAEGFCVESFISSEKGHNATFSFDISHDNTGDMTTVEFSKEDTLKTLNTLLRELGGCVLGNLSEGEKVRILDLADAIRREFVDEADPDVLHGPVVAFAMPA